MKDDSQVHLAGAPTTQQGRECARRISRKGACNSIYTISYRTILKCNYKEHTFLKRNNKIFSGVYSQFVSCMLL